MTTTLVFRQYVNLSRKFSVAGYRTGFSKNLSSFDISSLDTTKQNTDVITSLCLIQQLTEHLDTCYNRLLCLFLNTDDLNIIRHVQCTTLYSTCSNGTTACDGEYVLDRHKERLICVTLRIRNILINCAHQLHDLVAPLAAGIFQSFQRGTLNDRAICELILFQLLCDLHLNQLKQLRIVYHIALVHEYYDIRNAYLTGQKDVLFGLSHNTICSSYNKDSAIHLSSTCDHVLNVVSMSRAVNVCVMSLICLVLNVSCRDCDTSFSLFRSLIDVLEICSSVTCNSLGKYFCDRCCQCRLTMVNVTNGADITMWFVSFKLSLSHF